VIHNAGAILAGPPVPVPTSVGGSLGLPGMMGAVVGVAGVTGWGWWVVGGGLSKFCSLGVRDTCMWSKRWVFALLFVFSFLPLPLRLSVIIVYVEQIVFVCAFSHHRLCELPRRRCHLAVDHCREVIPIDILLLLVLIRQDLVSSFVVACGG